ncbi:HIT family protein [Streptomyces zingiberis]|uniref:HIT family protein n=1 Tax=Streptomyces zingiberis TaxID=2053010 RepID=A0ABX1BVZ8_9ACTN|nr:HIT family protein [Streptomyces zingiberis]NJP99576.1 HIT family protein [Streptomyces zingiberis]
MKHELRCVESDFCNEISGQEDTTFSAIYEGNPPGRVLWESGNFRLLADMSPLCPGHLLLLPIEHHLSFADLIETHGETLSGILSTVIPMYRETFGRLTFLEHGSSLAMKSGACISHAHWHLLPVDGRGVDALITADGLPSNLLEHLGQLATFSGKPYFLCGHEGEFRVYNGERPMRSQYLRSVVGRILGIPDPLWDYALVVRKEILRETMDRASHWRTPLADAG